MDDFLLGGAFAAALAIAAFFLRYARDTGDRFFTLFALAFVALATNRLLLVLVDDEQEDSAAIFAIRAVAFLLIIVAVVDKNRSGQRS